MDSSEYKQIKEKWNVKCRNTIVDSMALIKDENAELHSKLENTLNSEPVKKPSEHSGGKETDYFEVQLTEDEMQELVDMLFDLEASAVPQGDGVGFENEALQAREASRIAALVDEWNKLNAE